MKNLRRLTKKLKLQNDFFVWDTETGTRHKDFIQYELRGRPENFIFGVVYGRNYKKVIYSVEEFKKEFKHERYKKKKVFAHNAIYDLNTIYGNIFDLDPKAIFNGKFISASNGNCLFCDSFNIYAYSVAKIGEKIGIEKPELGNEDMKSYFVNGEINPADIERCTKDCEIIFKALWQIFEEVGNQAITQASLSLNYFRRFHQEMNIEHNGFVRYFWKSYFGGRTEAFKLGKTHAVVYDINSSYPYAMRECIFPNPKFLRPENNPTKKRFKELLNEYEGTAYLTLKHKKHFFGFLPHKETEKLLFPIGKLKGWFNFIEIRFALEHGIIEIEKIHNVIWSYRMKSPFKNYVETLYNRRVTSNNPMEIERIKIYMNSLYGKFAQRINEEWIYIDNLSNWKDEITEYQRKRLFKELKPFSAERDDYFLVIHKKDGHSLNYAIPSFPSYITSFARIHLLKMMLKYQNNKPVYCDTDSIFFEIDPNLPDEYELGGWKKENKIITEIRGLKNYSYYLADDPNKEIKNKIKGVPKEAIQTEENFFIYQNLLKTKEALRRKMEPGILVDRSKRLTGKYEKRIVLKNGETLPIKL